MIVALTVFGKEFGGAEMSVVNMVRACTSEEQTSFILVGLDCIGMRKLAEHLPELPTSIVPGQPGTLKSIFALRKAYRNSKADFVQVTLCNPASAWDAQIAAISAGIPTIAIEQLVRPITKFSSRMVKRWLSRCLTDHVAVGKKSAREVEILFNLPKNSVRTIYNGVEVPLNTPKPRNGFVIGTIGRLEAQKAPHRLVEALRDLPGVELHFVGSGSLKKSLQDQVEKFGLSESVYFWGWQRDPHEHLANFDLFVLPSDNEAFPLSIVEAMFLKVPVVATNVGSVSEAIVNNETGVLLDISEIDRLPGVLDDLLKNKSLRNQLSESAHKLATKNFSANSMAASYQSMWNFPRGKFRSQQPSSNILT